MGATLAAEVAAFSRASVRRLVLIAPLGLFDANEPPADLFAQRLSAVPPLLCAHPERYEAFLARPDGADAVEWEIETARAQEAVARLLWPLTDTGLAKRLHRITRARRSSSGAPKTGSCRRAMRSASPTRSAAPPRSARSPARGTWSSSTRRRRLPAAVREFLG